MTSTAKIQRNNKILLSLLGRSQTDFDNFHSVHMIENHIVVVLYAGGHFRKNHDFEKYKQYDFYSHDEDDTFNDLYAHVYFKIK